MARPASWPGQVKENPCGSSSGRTIVRTGSSPALLDESVRSHGFVAISSHLPEHGALPYGLRPVSRYYRRSWRTRQDSNLWPLPSEGRNGRFCVYVYDLGDRITGITDRSGRVVQYGRGAKPSVNLGAIWEGVISETIRHHSVNPWLMRVPLRPANAPTATPRYRSPS